MKLIKLFSVVSLVLTAITCLPDQDVAVAQLLSPPNRGVDNPFEVPDVCDTFHYYLVQACENMFPYDDLGDGSASFPFNELNLRCYDRARDIYIDCLRQS